MKTRTNRTGWDKGTRLIDDHGTLQILTRRDEMVFEGDDAFSLAVRQAWALAAFFPSSGRYLVYNDSDDDSRAHIEYDQSRRRVGVLETHSAEAHQHCNSGTCTWIEARTFEM